MTVLADRIVAETLERARVVLRERGHCKHKFEDFDGSVCLSGAVAIACGKKHPTEVPREGTVYAAAMIALAESITDQPAETATYALIQVCDYNNQFGSAPDLALANAIERERSMA